jgi:hypothetical protein
MTTNQILKGAADRLRAKGWCQGHYAELAETFDGAAVGMQMVPAGSPCGAAGNLAHTPVAATDVIGALRQVGGNDPNVDVAKAKLRKRLKVDNLADWNDEEGRTVEQVIAALERAAA